MSECPTCERDDFYSEKGMKIHHANVHGESIAFTTKECEVCGRGRKYRDCRMEMQSHFFCGENCRAKWESERMSEREVSEDTKRKISESKTGEGHHFYGKQLTEEHRENLRQSLLGREVTWGDKVGEANRGNRGMIGEENPRWKGGNVIRRGPNWNSNRRKVLKRDFYRCRLCRMTNGEHMEKHGRSLEVHHRTPRSWFVNEYEDEVEALRLSNRLHNLITLCCSCHIKLEAKISR